jgi:hypothetical protein
MMKLIFRRLEFPCIIWVRPPYPFLMTLL